MRVIVCLDGSEFARAALPPVRELAVAAGAEVELLRVIDPEVVERDLPRPPDDAGADVVEASGADPSGVIRGRAERRAAYEQEAARHRERLRAQLTERAQAEMRAAAGDLGSEPEATVLFESDVSRAIIEHARMRDASLIAMSTHSRRPVAELLLGSVAHAVLSSGVKPVLLVHPTD